MKDILFIIFYTTIFILTVFYGSQYFSEPEKICSFSEYKCIKDLPKVCGDLKYIIIENMPYKWIYTEYPWSYEIKCLLPKN